MASHGAGDQVTAQPVGHGAYDGMEDVLLLRTRALNSITVDLATGTATVGAGVKAGELLEALQGTGLTFLAGSSPDPTVVGLTIGGGLSWFGRAYGLSANAVVAVELVDGLGRARRITQDSDPELFWAVRGGGGNFGIITSITIGLMPGFELYGGRLLWPVSQMPAVLRAFRAVAESAPDTLTLWYHTYQFPPLPVVPEPLRGKAFAAVAATFLGSSQRAEELLAPLRAIPGLVLDLMAELPMHELGRITDEPVEPSLTLDTSALLDDLDDELIGRLVEAVGEGSRSPLAVFQIRHLGGAMARPRTGQGAAGHISEPYLMFGLGIPVVPELESAIRGTFARLRDAAAGHGAGKTVPNLLSPGDDVSRIWSPDTLRRLTSIKHDVDPLFTIRSNRPLGG